MSILVTLLALATGGVVLYLALGVLIRFDGWDRLLHDHFAAMVGLPCAAALALLLVRFLRHTSGPAVFQGFGFKLEGAGGPIMMWIFCFLAIAAAIRLLW
jgi:hypothetical protein